MTSTHFQTTNFKALAIASAVALSGFAITVPNANAQYYRQNSFDNHTTYGPGGSSLQYNQMGQFRNYNYNNGRGGRSSMTCSTIGQYTNCF